MKVLLFLLIAQPILAGGAPNLIYLVRHAEKVDKSDNSGLTAVGQVRAQNLAAFLEKVSLDAVYSSQFRRTKDTIQPLLEGRKTPHRVIPANQSKDLVEALTADSGKTFLVSGHSNTIPEIIQLLGGGVEPIDDSDYDNLYLVIHTSEGVSVQHFKLTAAGGRSL